MKRTAGWEQDAIEEVAEFLEMDPGALKWKRDTEFKNALVVKVPGKRTPVLVFKSRRDAHEAAVQNVQLDLVQDPLGIAEDTGWVQRFVTVKSPEAVAREEVEDYFDLERTVDEVDTETLAYEAGMRRELAQIFDEETRVDIALDDLREMYGEVERDDDPRAEAEMERIQDEIDDLVAEQTEIAVGMLDFRGRALEAWKDQLVGEWAQDLVAEPIYWAEERRGSNLVELPEWMVFDARAAAEDYVNQEGTPVGLSGNEAVLGSGVVVYDF